VSEARPLTLAYLDLDRFKLINDLYGHAAGDDILREVCVRTSGMLAGTQQIGRVGGDEFVIVMPYTAIAPAAWACRGIIERIGTEPYRLGDKAFQVRGSIGLIEVDRGASIRDVMANADRACRAAKAEAGSGLVVYERHSAVFRERQAEMLLVEHLSAADAADFLFLEMQPIMSLSAPHGSLNFEVLLRMRGREGGVIQAGRVIPAAESSGRIGMLDRWVLSTTLAWLGASEGRLRATQFVCMNLSGASLNDERFVQDTFAMLAANPGAARRLCMEITESVALRDLDNTRRFIEQVRSHGVKIALDDFGAGYTSFSYLKELPADVVKIDGSFIVDMNDDPANITIVEAIVTLAASLGMRTIAEWAEDQATVQALAELGVDYVQGYAVARSQSPETLLTFTSSAGFIKDEALLSYVKTLGVGGAGPDLLGLVRAHRGG
jgi:diguanylate cyclase (GGDEF)-like protein